MVAHVVDHEFSAGQVHLQALGPCGGLPGRWLRVFVHAIEMSLSLMGVPDHLIHLTMHALDVHEHPPVSIPVS